MSERTIHDLYELQSLSLKRKIAITKTRIIEAYNHYKGKVYISYSGGKDSTVLLHIARQIYPDIKAVFVNTGLEFPEIQKFVKENMSDSDETLYPIQYDKYKREYERTNFRKVICEKGYPVISKEVCESVYNARKFINKIIERERERESLQNSNNLTDLSIEEIQSMPYFQFFRKIWGVWEYQRERERERTKQSIFTRESLYRMSRGGQDNKYRKLVGLAEYDKRKYTVGKIAGNVRQAKQKKGEYP